MSDLDTPSIQLWREPTSKDGQQSVANHTEPAGLSTPRSRSRSVASSVGEVHTGKSWAESVDADPWMPLMLTLDGGGIRGYSSLLILQRLMHEVAEWETHFARKDADAAGEDQKEFFDEKTLLPCHYFDFMYGTSTGGLIATMLGRLRMTVPDCLGYYKEVGDSLFGKKRNPIPLATKYYDKPLEKAVRRIVAKHCPIHRNGTPCSGDDWYPWHLDDDGEEPPFLDSYGSDSLDRICHSVCLTAIHNKSVYEAYLLRTYNLQYTLKTPQYLTGAYNAGAEKMKVWQVTRATSAAPFYFKELILDIENERKIFKDGGIRENNPSITAWMEFRSMYGDDVDPALLLSVGTGLPNMENDGFAETWPGPLGHLTIVKKLADTSAVLKNMLVRYTQGEERHRTMVQHAKGEWNWYKRLNVDEGLRNLKLDHWVPSREKKVVKDDKTGLDQKKKVKVPGGKTLAVMERATAEYLARERSSALHEYAAPHVMISQAAQKMVRVRRAREQAAKTGDIEMKAKWEHFIGADLGRRMSTAKQNGN